MADDLVLCSCEASIGSTVCRYLWFFLAADHTGWGFHLAKRYNNNNFPQCWLTLAYRNSIREYDCPQVCIRG